MSSSFFSAEEELLHSDRHFKSNSQVPTDLPVHIRIQQRNGKKMITIIEGLATDLDLKKILRALKKMYHINGSIIKDEESNEIIQLQGDQRNNVYDFLTEHNICTKSQLKMHGY